MSAPVEKMDIFVVCTFRNESTALHFHCLRRVRFQISTNAKTRNLVTPKPTAPTLQAPTSVTARKGSRETAPTVKVSFVASISTQLIVKYPNVPAPRQNGNVLILLDTWCCFQMWMNAKENLVTKTPTVPTPRAHSSVCAG